MTTTHPSELALERHAVAELPSGERAALELHLGACARCQARLAELRADDARFAAELGSGPALERALAALSAEAAPPRRRWRAAAAAAGAMAMAAALALALWPSPPREFDGRSKGGGVLLEVVRRTPGGDQAWLGDEQRVHPGDAIRFRVRSPAAGYLAVLGLDARGVVSVYAPEAEAMSAIAARQPVTLDGSIVLDDTLGAERLVAVVCPAARPLADLVAAGQRALREAAGDPRRVGALAAECQEQALLVEKVAR